MTRSGKAKSGRKSAASREERLKAALRANMARRKAQIRARAAGEAGEAGEEAGAAGAQAEAPVAARKTGGPESGGKGQ